MGGQRNHSSIQCTYFVVKDAFVEQVYNRYYLDSGVDEDTMFFEYLGASDSSEAELLVTSMCESAQDEMALDAV